MILGGPLPPLTATYSGFVNGDTWASLTTLPTLLTDATVSSPISGNPYTITVSDAVDADYSISYVNGTLLVIDDPGTTIAMSISPATTSVYGTALVFTATVSASTDDDPQPTGTIQFEVDGSDFGSPVTLVNGSAKWFAD